jgi:general secretion pathway protein A
MYLGFYGLRKEPFHITPDPDFLFPGASHKEAFAAMVYGIQQRKGFIALTGEVGTGKTTVLRSYLKQVKRGEILPIYLFNPVLTFEELLRFILHEMEIDARGRPESWMLPWLHKTLIDAYKKKRNVVLIIDEAQNMPLETLEQLRMLSNLETTRDKLLQIVLVGQPELEEKLELHQLRQLRQRIAVRAVIKPLTRDESLAYIRHRVSQAGSVTEALFTGGALKTIVRHAEGNPRVINILADNSLLAGLGAEKKPVPAYLTREAIRDLDGPRKSWRLRLKWAVPAAAAAMLLIAGIVQVQTGFLRGPVDVSGTGTDPAAARQRSIAVHAAEREQTEAEAVSAQPETIKAALLKEKPAAVKESGETVLPPASSGDSEPEPVPMPEKARKELAALSQPEKNATPAFNTPDNQSSAAASAVTEAAEVIARRPLSDAEVEDRVTEKFREILEKNRKKRALPVLEATAEPETSVEPGAASLDKGMLLLSVMTPEQQAGGNSAPQTQTEAKTPHPAVTDRAIYAPLPLSGEAHSAAPGLLPEEGRLVTRVKTRKIEKGDSLSRLVAAEYGYSTPGLIETIIRLNPRIEDPDLILSGDTLVLPALAVTREPRPEHEAPTLNAQPDAEKDRP